MVGFPVSSQLFGLLSAMGRGCKASAAGKPKVKKDRGEQIPAYRVGDIDLSDDATYRNPDPKFRHALLGRLYAEASQQVDVLMNEYWDMICWNNATHGRDRSCFPSFNEFISRHCFLKLKPQADPDENDQEGCPTPKTPKAPKKKRSRTS